MTDKLTKEHWCPECKKFECRWKYDESCRCWETECCLSWSFAKGGPKENGLLFCPMCGKKINETQTLQRKKYGE